MLWNRPFAPSPRISAQVVLFFVALFSAFTLLAFGPNPACVAETTATAGQPDYTAPKGQTVSGTITYSQSDTGWVYLALVPTSGCSSCGYLGTAIDGRKAGSMVAPGMAYTIHGVPAGTYTLQAWMDNIGHGDKNANNPTGSLVGITVTTVGLTGKNVTLSNPAAVSLGTQTPGWDPGSGFGAFSGGAVVSFNTICNSKGCNSPGNELPTSYNLQYSTSSTFAVGVTTKSFPATNGNSPWVVTGLTNGDKYYFRAAGVVGSSVGNYSAAEPSGGLLIGPKTTGSPVSGTVSFTLPTGLSATGKTLDVGCEDMNTGNIYVDPVTSPVTPQAYSLDVPVGANCLIFGFIDFNSTRTGLIYGPGILSNASTGIGAIVVEVKGEMPNQDISLPSGNSVASLRTYDMKQTNLSGVTTTTYAIDFRVNGLFKQPVAVELLTETPKNSGGVADVVLPADIATNAFGNNNSSKFDLSPTVTGTPVAGDSYTFKVTYSDGTVASPNLSSAISAVLDSYPSNMDPTGLDISTTPSFTWSDPSPASDYVYQFQLMNASYSTIWRISGENLGLNGFPDTINSIPWGIDPTGAGNKPSTNPLKSNTQYIWQIQAADSHGNEATSEVAFQTTASNLALSMNNNGFGPALAGYPFSGSIGVSGGTGSGYIFTVNGTLITESSLSSAMTFSANDGLHAYSSGSNLYIVGTPTSAEPSLPINVKVTDSESNTVIQTFLLIVSSGPGTTGVNNKLLNGHYVCKSDGYDDATGARWTTLSELIADGNGNFKTGGIYDTNTRDLSAAISGNYTGTYSIGADYIGVANMVATINGSTLTANSIWAIAVAHSTTPATEFRKVRIDDVGLKPSGTHGSAVCYLATTSAFASSTLSGKNFAFSLQGENKNGIPKAFVGRMTLSTESATGGTAGAPGGTITSGILDGMRLDQTGDTGGTLTNSSTYTVPSSTTGRFTLSITTSSKTLSLAAYIIDTDRMFWLETGGDSGEMGGDLRLQRQANNTAATLFDGSSVLYGQAYEGNSSGGVTGFDSFVYQVSFANGAGDVNASFDDDNGHFTSGAEVGAGIEPTLDASNPGRATATCGKDSCYYYFFNVGSAFYLDLNGPEHYLETRWLEAQTQPASPPFAIANIAGSFLSGELPRLSSGDNDNIGVSNFTSNGVMTGSNTLANEGSLQWDQQPQGVFAISWLSKPYGAFSVLLNGSAVMSCIDITPVNSGDTGKVACIENTSQGANVHISEQ